MIRKITSILLAITITCTLLIGCGNKDVGEKSTENSTIENNEQNNMNTIPSTNEEVADNSQPTTSEPEKETIYNILNAEPLAPKFTYASNENANGYSNGAIKETNNPIYIAVIRVISDTDVSSTYNVHIPSLNKNQYYITEKVQSYLWNTSEWYNNAEAHLYDSVYVIEYTTDVDENVWLETETGKQIINLSTLEYKKEVKTDGNVSMYECAMLEDEYGTKHYVIPIAAGSDYANVGLADEEYGKAWYKFNLIQVGEVENVPTDLNHLSEFYWHPQNISIEYDGFEYYSEESKENNSIYIPSSSNDNFDHIRRDVGRYEIKFELNTKTPELFKDNSVIYLNFHNIRFCFNIEEWR